VDRECITELTIALMISIWTLTAVSRETVEWVVSFLYFHIVRRTCVDFLGGGGRIILLGDGTEITTEAADADMFDNDDEDKDRDFQVDRSNGAREETPGPQGGSTKESADSPSSVKTEKSEEPSEKKDTTVPDKVTAGAPASEK
jgi:hypothetical protein